MSDKLPSIIVGILMLMCLFFLLYKHSLISKELNLWKQTIIIILWAKETMDEFMSDEQKTIASITLKQHINNYSHRDKQMMELWYNSLFNNES